MKVETLFHSNFFHLTSLSKPVAVGSFFLGLRNIPPHGQTTACSPRKLMDIWAVAIFGLF